MAAQLVPVRVNASVSPVMLLDANPVRSSYSVVAEAGSATLYLCEGSTASSSSYTHAVPAGAECVDGMPSVWTGQVWGVWASATGSCMVQEH